MKEIFSYFVSTWKTSQQYIVSMYALINYK